jgi:ATP-dependent RNA helicase RhlE
MSFTSFGFHPSITRALEKKAYLQATEIQSKAIPVILKGRDVLAAAQTGTGKTAGFALPMLQILNNDKPLHPKHIKSLIIAPTRELALQIFDSFNQYGAFLQLKIQVAFGGVKINPQIRLLQTGADVLIATPGRLMDLYQQQALSFKQLEMIVLDEADRMLDMGFIQDIRKIMSYLPEKRQTLLFSATFSLDIKKLAQKFLNNPIEIVASSPNKTAPTVKHLLHPVDKAKKVLLLKHLIHTQNWRQAIIFTKTKHGADKLVKQLALVGIDSLAIHGNKTQAQRLKALNAFKTGKIPFLVATDIVARGLDIAELDCVVNFDLPQVAEDYVHRIGRTGRAGHEGIAVSLVCADEFLILSAIERFLHQSIRREEIEGFEPVHHLPHSNNPNALKQKHRPPYAKNNQQNVKVKRDNRR